MLKTRRTFLEKMFFLKKCLLYWNALYDRFLAQRLSSAWESTLFSGSEAVDEGKGPAACTFLIPFGCDHAPPPGKHCQRCSHLLRQHWVSATFLLLTSVTSSSSAAPLVDQAPLAALLEAETRDGTNWDLLPPFGPKDQAGFRSSRTIGGRSGHSGKDCSSPWKALSGRAMAIGALHCAVYHPECDVPELKPRLLESLHLRPCGVSLRYPIRKFVLRGGCWPIAS